MTGPVSSNESEMPADGDGSEKISFIATPNIRNLAVNDHDEMRLLSGNKSFPSEEFVANSTKSTISGHLVHSKYGWYQNYD